MIYWLLLISATYAQNSLQNYVEDRVGVMSAQDIADLNAIARDYDKATTNQLWAVIISWAQRPLADIWLEIFRETWLGTKSNNWLLLLIDAGARKLRIIVGYWLEWDIPDIRAWQIVESIRPLINSWDYAWAIRWYLEQSKLSIQSNESIQSKVVWNNHKSKFSWEEYAVVVLHILLRPIILINWILGLGIWLSLLWGIWMLDWMWRWMRSVFAWIVIWWIHFLLGWDISLRKFKSWRSRWFGWFSGWGFGGSGWSSGWGFGGGGWSSGWGFGGGGWSSGWGGAGD